MRQSEGTRANASFYYFFWNRELYGGTAGLIPAAARTVLDVQRYNTRRRLNIKLVTSYWSKSRYSVQNFIE